MPIAAGVVDGVCGLRTGVDGEAGESGGGGGGGASGTTSADGGGSGAAISAHVTINN